MSERKHDVSYQKKSTLLGLLNEKNTFSINPERINTEGSESSKLNEKNLLRKLLKIN